MTEDDRRAITAEFDATDGVRGGMGWDGKPGGKNAPRNGGIAA